MDMERRWEMIVEVSPGAMARLMGFSSKKLRGLFHQQRWYFFCDSVHETWDTIRIF